jgi:hypothetical protein
LRGNPGANRLHGNRSRARFWEAVDAGRDGGKRDGFAGVFAGEVEALTVAACEACVFVVGATMPDWADGMEDPFCGEIEAWGGLGVACVAASEQAARVEKVWAGGAMNGSVDSASAEERAVRGVDDCVHFEGGDVSSEGAQGSHRLVYSSMLGFMG